MTTTWIDEELLAVGSTWPVTVVDAPDRDRQLGDAMLERLAAHPLVVVARGTLLLDVKLGERTTSEVVGVGDVLSLHEDVSGILKLDETLTVLRSASLGLVHEPVREVIRRWPDLGARLMESSRARHTRQSACTAICQLPRVEDRVLAMLWHLAERFGTAGVDGVRVGLPLTHQQLSQLVGARRPTVSTALAELEVRTHVSRGSERQFLLSLASRHALP